MPLIDLKYTKVICPARPHSIIVQHSGRRISYRHQLWKVEEASVCAEQKGNIKQFSTCTVAAKSMFGEACLRLQTHPEEHWKHLRLKEMYCTFASTFQPTIAAISWGEEEETELSIAKRNCSTATAAAIGTRSPRILKKRDIGCGWLKQRHIFKYFL